jgi:hypothetical protein
VPVWNANFSQLITAHRLSVASEAAGLQSSPQRAERQSTRAHAIDYARDSAAGFCRPLRRPALPKAQCGRARASRGLYIVGQLARRTSTALDRAGTPCASPLSECTDCACSVSRSPRRYARLRLLSNRLAQFCLPAMRLRVSLRLVELHAEARRGSKMTRRHSTTSRIYDSAIRAARGT